MQVKFKFSIISSGMSLILLGALLSSCQSSKNQKLTIATAANAQFAIAAIALEFEKETGIKIHNFEELDLKNDFDGTTALIKSLDLTMGPGSAPIMQSAMAGVETWFVPVGYPWWRFGENTPIWRQNSTLYSKNDNTPWPEHMEECAKTFKKWLKDINADIIDIEKGTFKESGTTVGGKIIIINKKEIN